VESCFTDAETYDGCESTVENPNGGVVAVAPDGTAGYTVTATSKSLGTFSITKADDVTSRACDGGSCVDNTW